MKEDGKDCTWFPDFLTRSMRNNNETGLRMCLRGVQSNLAANKKRAIGCMLTFFLANATLMFYFENNKTLFARLRFQREKERKKLYSWTLRTGEQCNSDQYKASWISTLETYNWKQIAKFGGRESGRSIYLSLKQKLIKYLFVHHVYSAPVSFIESKYVNKMWQPLLF